MRQPSIEGAGERPPLALFDPFQVFDGNRFDARQVKLFEGRAQPRLDFGSGVLLAFGKVLNTPMQFLSNGLAIGEDQAAFVVGIHTQHATGFPLKRPGLCEDQIQPHALPIPPQPHGFGHFPTACKPPVDKTGGLEGQDQTRRARADQLYAPVEAGPCESFKGDEVIEQRRDVPPHRLAVEDFAPAAHVFLGLLRQGLRKPRGDAKALAGPMDGRQVRKRSLEVAPLPEQI
jgi:hypothetical protein